jgi:hypothetical protein
MQIEADFDPPKKSFENLPLKPLSKIQPNLTSPLSKLCPTALLSIE